MQKPLVLALSALLLLCGPLAAEVTLTKLDDRVKVDVNGKPFTEYRYKEWLAPYLYPVYGPNGETVTRHFPMKDGVPGEQQDHPHHRSIRFSHRDVNGYSFWAPNAKEGGKVAEIRLEKIEKAESGEEKGELIVLNQWLGDGVLVLTERERFTFIPLGNGEILMDYDVELTAADKPVKFGDQKDGGLGVRVAGTMVVTNRTTKSGKGTILNSRGDKDEDAWGKRAEWADYYGPDASGKMVGIAIFDHPSNLRYPTWWHARTYGLITANRFGTGYFDAKNGAERGDGDYTIEPGKTLKLRHRLYIHHGDSEAAKVAEYYKKYTEEG